MHMQNDTYYCMLHRILKKEVLTAAVASMISEGFSEQGTDKYDVKINRT